MGGGEKHVSWLRVGVRRGAEVKAVKRPGGGCREEEPPAGSTVR